jgi:ABC-type transport system substrate-binding protein
MSSRTYFKKAITKVQAAIIAIIIIVSIGAGIYLATLPPPTATVTQTVPTTVPTTTVVTTTVPTTTVVTTTVPTTTVVTTTPTTTTPVTDTLVVSVIGAHWANVKFGNDPSNDGAKATYIPLIYETLFTYDPISLQKGELKIIPWLAESYSVSNDQLTWTIKIRKGIKFHSGNPLTADDVIYSFNRYWFADWDKIATYLVMARLKTMPNYIVGFEKIDDYTVQIKLNKTIPFFTTYLADTLWSIVDSKLVKAHEKTLPEYGNANDYGYTFLNYEFGDAGTGPYKVKKVEVTVRYEFERFEDYWGGPPELKLSKPYFKYIVYIPVNEDADGRFKLLRGDVHVVSDFLADTVKALSKYPEVKTFMGPSPLGFGLWMHTVTGPLKDWRVRKAIKMALNYTELNLVAGAGGSVTAQGFFLPGMPTWEENARYFKDAQIAEANKLLDEAGYPVQSDGWRFHINLYLRPEPRWGLDFTKYGLLVKAQLAKVKIDAVPVVLQVSEYYAHVFNPAESMMWIQPFDTLPMPDTPMYLCTYWGQQPWFGYNKTTQPEIADKIDLRWKLYNDMINAPDDATRMKIFHEIEKIDLEYGPYVTIAAALWHVGYNAKLKNFFWSPRQLFPAIFYVTWS